MDGKIYNGIDNQIDLAPGDKEWLKAVLRPLEESAIHAGQEEFKTVLHEGAMLQLWAKIKQKEAYQRFLHSPYISTVDDGYIRDCMSKNMIDQFMVTEIELVDSWCVGPMGDPTAFRTNFCAYINDSRIKMPTIWSECQLCPFMERGKRYVWPLDIIRESDLVKSLL